MLKIKNVGTLLVLVITFITVVNLSSVLALVGPTITFGALSNKTMLDADFQVSATSTLVGFPVEFSRGRTTACDVTVEGMVHIVSAGTCIINAYQRAGIDDATPIDVTQTFEITKAPQTITFTSGGNGGLPKSFNQGGGLGIGGSSSAGLELTYSTSPSDICTNSGRSINIKKKQGVCTVTASQAGDDTYLPAEDVTQTMQVNAAHGVPNSVLDAGPNGGDANDDKVQDSLQSKAMTHATPAQSLVVTSGTNNGSDDEGEGEAPSISSTFTILEIKPDATAAESNSIEFYQPFKRPQFPANCVDTERYTMGERSETSGKSLKEIGTPNTSKTCKYTATSTTYFFPVGGFSFGIIGEGVLGDDGDGGTKRVGVSLGTTTISIYLDKVYDTTGWTLKKGNGSGGRGGEFGPSLFTDGPEVIPGTTFTTVAINGIPKTKITYQVADDGAFDDDIRFSPFDDKVHELGKIVDPIFILAPFIPVVVPPAPTPVSSGGGGGGSGGSIVINSNPIATIPKSSEPKVLGASTDCGIYLPLAKKDYLTQGRKNTTGLVIKLKKFLNTNLNLKLKEDSVFDSATTKAVKNLQSKYSSLVLTPWNEKEATGIVYVTTANTINNIVCPPLNLKFSESDLKVIQR